jgi:5'-3' exoribonuclease 1
MNELSEKLDLSKCKAITQCKCQMMFFELPDIQNGFRFGLCKGARLGANLLPGFPSVKTLAHTATLGFHGVTPFKVESK